MILKIFNSLCFTSLLFLIFTVSCTNQKQSEIQGSIDYLGGADFFFFETPLHYKYSPIDKFEPLMKGSEFSTQIPLDHPKILNLQLADIQYPIFAEPGSELTIKITRSTFPLNVKVLENGTSTEWNEAYQTFISQSSTIEQQISLQSAAFVGGDKNNITELSLRRLELAKKYLKDTPLHPIYLKVLGEDIVYRLRDIEYSARFNKNIDATKTRKQIIEYAKEVGFFELETLKSQRAGIRDFTHYYARTFGIYDSVISQYGNLSEFDIKRLAYPELNKKRLEVIDFINDKKAKAYAELFLVAERIGELPLETARPSYEEYLQKYAEFDEYTDFLTHFYNEIKSVSPGEPAIPFTLPDRKGQLYSLNDFEGKFVLLDFWAGWCQPCIDEFDDMRKIYNEYSREEFEIVGISNETDSLIWRRDLQRFDNPWIQLYGGKGFNQETFKAYKGSGIPFYILVDPDGKIARYNDVRPSFNFTAVLDSLRQNYSHSAY